MSLEDLKDLLFKVSMGRRDAAEQLAEIIHELQKAAEKPKKVAAK